MKKIFRLLLAAIVLVVIFIGAMAVSGSLTNKPSDGETVSFTVEKGAFVAEIAADLKEQGLIMSESLFRLKVKLSDKADKINYGTYVLEKGMSDSEIIEIMTSGAATEGVSVTIPEGYSAEMIAKKLEENGLCSAKDFLAELNKTDYDDIIGGQLPDSADVKYRLQGYLFPDTYMFDKSESVHDIVGKLTGHFRSKLDSIGGNTSAYSMNELMTIASLIEREAKLADERAVISGVIYNRLNQDMILQIDATVIYALSDGLYDMPQVTYDDLKVDSLYNTYMYRGLPPGPICNPGLESIKAAMNPDRHNYLYYHTDLEANDGSHIFTETLEQHSETMNY